MRITELLAEVDGWIGLSDRFTHLRTNRPAEDPRVVLTAVLADATNLGLTRMAEACSLATRRQLTWIAGWHLREETYGRALGLITDALHRQPLAAMFGPGTSSSSDGQHFPVGGPGESVGAVNARHGSSPAVSFYAHVSDRYAVFHDRGSCRPPPARRRASSTACSTTTACTLDVAVHHDLWRRRERPRLRPRQPGSGFVFAPRIPNLGDQRLHTFEASAETRWPALAPIIGSRVDAELSRADPAPLGRRGSRLATSVRTGAANASLMLRRLGSYPRQNGLALALREIGRVERTLFTLDWGDAPRPAPTDDGGAEQG